MKSTFFNLGVFAALFFIFWHLNWLFIGDANTTVRIFIDCLEGGLALTLGWIVGNRLQESLKKKPKENLIHKTDHKCTRCKKEYDCYVRNDYDECPYAYYFECMDCRLERLVENPSMVPTHHPERKMKNIIV